MRNYNTSKLSLILILLLLLIIPSCAEDNSLKNVIYDFTVRNDDQNSLRIIAEWKTLHPASSKIEYRESTDSENWLSTPLFAEKVMEHKVIIVGLYAETEYVFRPISEVTVGTELAISTKTISHFLPRAQLTVNNVDSSSIGLTIGGFPSSSTIVAVSSDGRIIWYHQDSDEGDPGDFLISEGDGRLIYNTIEAIKAVDYLGKEEVLLDIESFGEVCHHDFLSTPEGNYMYLSWSRIIENDQEWCTDEIVERDADGNEVWRWSTADHADELGGIEAHNVWQILYIEGCGYDWTHANSIDLNIDKDGKKFVILSIRNMDRVIKIDYPSGEILWQLGNHLDFTFTGSEPEELQWFRCQHCATYHEDPSSILLFDNGNERYEVEAENFSRVLLYKIDEENMTTEISWAYDFERFAPRIGEVRRLLNGNFLITFPCDRTWSTSAFIQVGDSKERVWQCDFFYFPILYSNNLVGGLRISSLYDLYNNE